MLFYYASRIRQQYPELRTGVLRLNAIGPDASVSARVSEWLASARARIAQRAEGDLPEIQAWRRAYARMGLKPTQYRCAPELLLRRLRKGEQLPALHPLVDLCQAASAAHAIPIAVFDLDKVSGNLQVRHAKGAEIFETAAGDYERPEVDEVIVADDSQRAHARRWVHRPSPYSAVQAGTRQALLVIEALHPAAEADVARVVATLRGAVTEAWPEASVRELMPR